LRLRQIAQPVLTEVDEVDVLDQRGRRCRDQYLSAVTNFHGPGGTVQRRPEVIISAQLGGSGANAHANRQLQSLLRHDGGINGRARRTKGRDDAVTSMFEQPTVIALDSISDDIVMPRKRRAHALRLLRPSPSGAFNVGHEKGYGSDGTGDHIDRNSDERPIRSRGWSLCLDP
jgi:hypothetical protein